MKRVPLRIFTLSAVSCVFLGACYDKQPVRPPKDRQFPDFSYKEPESPRAAVRLPWEVWMPFQDLDGARLSNRSLLLGDEHVDKGKRRSALEAYLTALSDPLLPREAETAALRISSQYLALDRATKALSTVSNYFKQRGLSEQQVSLPFALILGFAYGRYGDVDQALAWFSRANRQATGKGFGTEVARTGTSLLLRTLPPEKFEDIALNWRSDSFVNELIGRERMRRASRAYDPDDFKADVPFWSSYTDEALKAETMPISPVGTEPRIGVILSLSDRFAS
jgi:tetratricopeptide (TPR) repeat protein